MADHELLGRRRDGQDMHLEGEASRFRWLRGPTTAETS
jgi:hypothetical protein